VPVVVVVVVVVVVILSLLLWWAREGPRLSLPAIPQLWSRALGDETNGRAAILTGGFRTSRFTRHPSPFTLHTSPSTLHPPHFTLHTSPFTLHPSPFTRCHGHVEGFLPRPFKKKTKQSI
jgi:hypothetical protein